MRIIHFSDLHLGTETYGRIDAESGLSTRLLDALKALDELVAFAIEAHADLVVFTGDAYRSRDPSQTHQREFAKRLKQLSAAGVPVFLLVGNHDLPGAISRANSLEIFPTLAVDKVFVGNRPEVTVIPTASGPVQVAALPWARRGLLLGKDDAKGKSLEDINRILEERLTETALWLAGQVKPDIPAVLAAHAMVSGAKAGSEGALMMGRDPVLLPGNLALAEFDYVALGHVHRSQCLAQHPPACYAGSLIRLDFSDETQEKGFYVVDLDPAGPPGKRLPHPPEFHAVVTRRFVTLAAGIRGDDPDPTGTVLRMLEHHAGDIADAIVRLQITLPESSEGLIRDWEIQKALQPAHHAAIARIVERQTRSRLGNIAAEQLTPAQALDLYLKEKKVTEAERKKLMEYGEKLIRETLGERK